MQKYPVKIKLNGDTVLQLRKDEVQLSLRDPDKTNLELGDAIEREFWKKSNEELILLKNELSADQKLPVKVIKRMMQSIDRVLKQREFMIDNQHFRESLQP